MRSHVLLLIGQFLAIGLVLTACNDADDGSPTVNRMAFPEVQQRIIAALFPRDAVMHTREVKASSVEGKPVPPPLDIWRNAGAGEARIDGYYGIGHTLYLDGNRYRIRVDGEVQEEVGPADPTNDELFGAAALILSDSAYAHVTTVQIDGIDAIHIAFQWDCIDSCGPFGLVVSAADFLPLQTADGEVRFEHERVDRSALPDDFFSLASLKALAEGLPSAPDTWRAQGHTPYWLGMTFEDLVPRAWIPLAGGGIFLLRYATPATAVAPNETCVEIRHQPDASLPLRDPVEQLVTVRAPIGEVTIYRHEDVWAALHVLAEGGSLVVLLHCKPYSEKLASLAGMTRVANALRVYDGPSRMADFVALSAATP